MSKESKSPAGGKKRAKTATARKPAAKKAPSAEAVRKPAAIRAKRDPKPEATSAAAPQAKSPAKRAARPAAKPTAIQVEADIGFGNQMFIRGEGGGLSWDRGIPMECKSGDHWEWSAQGVAEPLSFKVLINDHLWAQGENLEVKPGETKVVQPRF